MLGFLISTGFINYLAWGGLVVAAVAMASLIGFFAMPVGRLFNVVDIPDPGGRKRHAEPTPLVGGLATMVPTLIMGLILFLSSGVAIYGALTLLCTGMLILGLFDDRAHIPPLYRLTISLALCGGVVFIFSDLALVQLDFSTLGTSLVIGAGGIFLSAICLVALQNAVNMADGRNGLVVGMALIWTVLTAAYAPIHLLPILAVFGAALMVTFAFNWRGRLFLGDAGAYSLSAMVGAMAIYTYMVSPVLTADMVILWFMIPVLDCLRLIWFRLNKGISPFEGDRNHFHHYLSDMMNWRAGIIVYLSMVAVPPLVVIQVPELTSAMMLLSATLYFGVLWASRRSAFEKRAVEGIAALRDVIPLPMHVKQVHEEHLVPQSADIAIVVTKATGQQAEIAVKKAS